MLAEKQIVEICNEIDKLIKDKPYYNGRELLLHKDIDKKPQIMNIITSNRSAGKTSYFLMFSYFLKKLYGKRTVMFFRYTYEVSNAHSVYTDVVNQYAWGEKLKSVKIVNDLLYEMFIDDESIGYAMRLGNVDTLKKFSPLFADIEFCMMDEMQTESGKYLKKEVQKMQSLLWTIGRGGGIQKRDILTCLIGNPVSILNPYFIALGIHTRYSDNTHFLRGKGWVAEFNINKEVVKQSNGSSDIFDTDYNDYATDGTFLINADSFIQKPEGKSKYLFTIIYDNILLGVREFLNDGIIHISNKPDSTCNTILAFKASDHNQITILLKRASYSFSFIREAFEMGNLRFSDMKTKNIIFEILAVDIYK